MNNAAMTRERGGYGLNSSNRPAIWIAGIDGLCQFTATNPRPARDDQNGPPHQWRDIAEQCIKFCPPAPLLPAASAEQPGAGQAPGQQARFGSFCRCYLDVIKDLCGRGATRKPPGRTPRHRGAGCCEPRAHSDLIEKAGGRGPRHSWDKERARPAETARRARQPIRRQTNEGRGRAGRRWRARPSRPHGERGSRAGNAKRSPDDGSRRGSGPRPTAGRRRERQKGQIHLVGASQHPGESHASEEGQRQNVTELRAGQIEHHAALRIRSGRKIAL